MNKLVYTFVGISLCLGLVFVGTHVYAQSTELATTTPVQVDVVTEKPQLYQIKVSRPQVVFLGTLDQLDARKKLIQTKIDALEEQLKELDNQYEVVQ